MNLFLMIYDLFRWFAIIQAYPAWLLFFKTKVFYKNKKVQSKRIDGGALIISNHFEIFDYMNNMFLLLPRKLYVVASEHAYKNAWISFGMRFFGGIKVDRRTKSLGFIDESVRLIEKGKIVQIFPEGKNTDDGEIAPFKPTYLMIALRANKPIIPIITDGNYGFFKRTHVLIGEPINLSEHFADVTSVRERLEALNDMVYQHCLEMKKELSDLVEEQNRGNQK